MNGGLAPSERWGPSGREASSRAFEVITAVLSRKGGVGKTTTAVNLAAALAGGAARVLVIDPDSQASASLSPGVPCWALAPSAADGLLGRSREPSTRLAGTELARPVGGWMAR